MISKMHSCNVLEQTPHGDLERNLIPEALKLKYTYHGIHGAMTHCCQLPPVKKMGLNRVNIIVDTFVLMELIKSFSHSTRQSAIIIRQAGSQSESGLKEMVNTHSGQILK